VESVFPNARYIFLNREDEVKRAISHLIAIQTDIWSHWEQLEKRARLEPEYSEADLDELIAQNQYAEQYWNQYFGEYGIEPLRITYEQLIQDRAPTVVSVLRHIGLPNPSERDIPEPTLIKQSNKLSGEWYERYTASKQQTFEA